MQYIKYEIIPAAALYVILDLAVIKGKLILWQVCCSFNANRIFDLCTIIIDCNGFLDSLTINRKIRREGVDDAFILG